MRAPNQRSADEHTTKLSLVLGQEMNGEDALDFSLQDGDLQLGALTAKVETQGLVLAAKLKKARLEKARLEETRLEKDPESKPTSAWQLTGNWQLDAALKQPLCLTLPPYPQTGTGCQDRPKNKTDIDNRLTLAKANLQLEGELDAKQADATDDSTNDSQKNSTLNLTLAGELNLAQPEFNHRDLKVGASQITTEIPAPLNLSLEKGPELKLNLDWQGLKVAINGHHLSWPAIQEMANKEPKAQLTSEQTRTSFGAGHFTFSPGRPLLVELASFMSVTHSPRLTLPQASMAEISITDASRTERAAKPLERELTASEFVLEAAEPLRLDAQALVLPPVGLKVIALAASEQKAVQGKGQEQAQAQVKTTQVKTTQVKTTRVNLDELSLATQSIALTPKATKTDTITGTESAAAKLSQSTLSQSTLSLSPDALLAFPWQSEANYQLTNLKVSEESVRLNKLRRKTLIKLPSASLSQSLHWQGALQTSGSSGTKSYSGPVSEPSKILIQLAGDSNGHYGLTTKEKWNLDGLPFYSEHHLGLTQSLKPRLLTGELTLESDANELMKRLMRMQGASLENPLIGDINLTSQHSLNWLGDKMDFAFALIPEVKLSEGSYNALPFEQAEFTGQCQLDGVKAPNSQTAKLACEPLSLKVAAFNPGVLITDINAHAKLELDLTQGETEAATGAQTGAQTGAELALSGADVKLDARANTLGGEILLPIFNLNLGAPSSAYLVLQGLDLEQLLAAQPQTGIYADGIFDGVLPVQLEHGQVSITNGQLAARAPGGLIKVDDNPAVLQMRLSQPYLDFAFSALEELHYTQLSSSFDMAPNGDALLKVQVKGRAKDIERPIHLNYAQEENMLQLLKSLQIGDRLQSEIERAMAN